MQTRILLFEDEEHIRAPLSNYLQAQGYEVLAFPAPATCALVAKPDRACPRGHACADMMIADMNLPEISGLELIRLQKAQGCQVPPRNKALIATFLTPAQRQELDALGGHCLRKPFQLQELLAWVGTCERNIPPSRELEPLEELWRTAGKEAHPPPAVTP